MLDRGPSKAGAGGVSQKNTRMPEHISPLCVIAVGVPTGEDKPRDKYNAAHVHFNKWAG